MSKADPRIIALESQFGQLHTQLFNTFSHAQSAVMGIMQTGRDISQDSEDYQQLKRDFDITVTMYPGEDSLMATLIAATRQMANNPQVSNVHMTQVWAAAVSALSCDRMLLMIPADLHTDPEVSGELQQKRQEHLTMWQERLNNP
ncbi:hypothetical protein [Alteromonas lipolytica]|uniref:Uncharacterized protein n=1 Tax=Alteromonas lipolytica TaxID=1856405 RepID=A0A1E8FJN9_9ALTE|nr:hypothetical protein [Alteromonas lipolytica]OFI36142.1 hypothetical protein BFC17_09360 [Alteromonas lipolytica]GGF86253.1 hypothetical protein GCM10011338_43250 [Alteromonas lipolytica]